MLIPSFTQYILLVRFICRSWEARMNNLPIGKWALLLQVTCYLIIYHLSFKKKMRLIWIKVEKNPSGFNQLLFLQSSTSFSSDAFHTFIHHSFPVLSCRIYLIKRPTTTTEHSYTDWGSPSISILFYSHNRIFLFR